MDTQTPPSNGGGQDNRTPATIGGGSDDTPAQQNQGNNNTNNNTRQQGRRQGQGANNNNNNNNNNFHRRGQQQQQQRAAPKFTGRCEDVGGHIYDCTAPRDAATQFVLTTREISEYVGREYSHGGDIRLTVLNQARPTLTEPSDPAENATRTQVRIWERKCDAFVRREEALEENIKKAYALVYGQCTEAMRARVESAPGYVTFSPISDVIALLKAIKQIMFQYQEEKYPYHALFEAKRRFYTFAQDRSMSCAQYLETFRNNVEVIEHAGGEIGMDRAVWESILRQDNRQIEAVTEAQTEAATADNPAPTQATADQIQAAKALGQQQFLACAFLLGANRKTYGKLVEDIENDYTQKVDKYPKSLINAYTLLTNWKMNPRNLIQALGTQAEGVAFTTTTGGGTSNQNRGRKQQQSGTSGDGNNTGNGNSSGAKGGNTGGTSAKDKSDQTTPKESEKGQQKGESATQMLMQAKQTEFAGWGFCNVRTYTYTYSNALQQRKESLPSTWILMDSGSNTNIFVNKQLLTNIHPTDCWLTVNCNAGSTRTNLKGTLPGYPEEVWYNPHGIANIMALSHVEDHFRVTYNSDSKAFVVHKGTTNDGTDSRTFQRQSCGLYVLDTAAPKPKDQKQVTFVTTVAKKAEEYTAREVQQATLARKIHDIIGRPSRADYIKIVDGNLIPNCPITSQDIRAAEDIFGPNLGSLKGKTVRRETSHVDIEEVPLPPTILSRYRDVRLCIDIMFVNAIPFFITLSRALKFGTVTHLVNRQVPTVLAALKGTQRIYSKRGFRIQFCLADNEFEVLRDDLAALNIELNTAGAAEHVPEIERYIRTVKERTRATYNTLPFKAMPARLLIEMVCAAVFWLNVFPPADGVSTTASPRALVTGLQLDFRRHCRLEFGAYVQTHEDHDNSMQARTTGALALRPTGNQQGGYYFLSLTTGRVLTRARWTALNMPQEVIDRVHKLARRSKANRNLTFAWRDGTVITDLADVEDDDDSSDSTYQPEPESDGEDGDDDDEDAVVIAPQADPPIHDPRNEPNAAEADEDNDSTADTEADADDAANHDHGATVPAISEDEESTASNATEVNEETTGVETTGVGAHNETEAEGTTGVEPEQRTGVRRSPMGPIAHGALRELQHGLRPRQPVDYRESFAHIAPTLLAQYSVAKGLKIWGEAGADAVIKEMQQLDMREAIEPVMAHMLTAAEKKAALEYLMFIQKKRTGRMKGRGCADGRKQRVYKTKEETSAPTVATESLMITAAIAAHEHRHVLTCDIPGAFLQTTIDELLHMVIRGPLAKLLVRMNPTKYQQYLSYIRGQPIIYVRLKKAVYGTLQAALLFWNDLSAALIEWGFTLNPYDTCVANKEINGKQCTVVWHVDDLMITHVDPQVLQQVLAQLNQRFGKEVPLAATDGPIHDYLGMTFDFTIPGKVTIRMDDYVSELLDATPTDMAGTAITPAAEYLYTVNPEATPLEPQQADAFHTMTAKLLFLCKRARPDLQPAVAFLTTRVRGPDIDDQKKLARVIRYLRRYPTLALTLEATHLPIAKWWIDAAYAVHPDMKSQTGAMMSLGKGAVISSSLRQKLNTTSSTEAELVGVHDVLSMVLWTRLFIEAQGHQVGPAKIYQDNESSILLETRGRKSTTKRTRHLDVRYFFVADKVLKQEVTIAHCPTEIMLADPFTKPLQGAKFRRFRAAIMNLPPHDEEIASGQNSPSTTTEPQECVVIPPPGQPRLGH